MRDCIDILRAAPVLPPSPRGPLPASAVRELLPPDHRAVLEAWGTVVTRDRIARLRGLGEAHGLGSLDEWNEPTLWKHAWARAPITDYVCFGETAWGDQFAYRRHDLGRAGDPPIYELVSANMEPRFVSSSFSEFLSLALLLHTAAPDEFVTAALQRHPGLRADQHIAHVPPELIGSIDDAERDTVLMPAAAHLVVLGDVHTQIVGARPGALARGMEAHTDSSGRMRARVLF